MTEILCVHSVKITGEVVGYLFRNGEKIPKIIECSPPIFEQFNTIDNNIKTRFRDSLVGTSSTVSYMGSGGFFTTCNTTTGEDNHDGISMVYHTGPPDNWVTLVTVTHPSDASGNYYKKWRGTLTSPGSASYDRAFLGLDWDGGTGAFTKTYASTTFDEQSFVAGDVHIIDWKISIS